MSSRRVARWETLSLKQLEALKEQLLDAEGNRFLDNRPIRWYWVHELARRMKDGQWDPYNGETVQIDRNGHVLNGQHRILAALEAGIPLVVLVVRGLEPRAYDSIDTGKARSPGDAFATVGEKNFQILASSLKWLWRYQHKLLGSHSPVTIHELRSVLGQFPDIRDSSNVGNQCRRLCSAGIAACLHFLFKQRSASHARQFFSKLCSGEGLSRTDETQPILKIREELILNGRKEGRNRRTTPSVRYTDDSIWIALVLSWNAYRQGAKVKAVLASAGKYEAGVFPEIE
jgi:hypothetical protein